MSRGHGQPGPAGQLRGALGRERGRLLVPYVDDPHLLPDRRVVDREDVPAGEREHLLDPGRPQRGDRDVAAVTLDRLHAPDPTDR